jgi:hypothetical protein
MQAVFSLWNSIQQYLIPHIEENLESPSGKERQFIWVAELAGIDKFIKPCNEGERTKVKGDKANIAV